MTEPATEMDFEAFAQCVGGHTAFQLTRAGVELGVFDYLAEHPERTRAEIGEALGLKQQPTRMLMLGLTSLRLVHKDGERYRNSAIVSKLLVSSTESSWIPFLKWQHEIVYRGQTDLVESFRQGTNVGLRQFPGTGDNIYERLTHSPDLEAVFQHAMSSLSRSANRMLADELDLSGVRHLVDAGGGDGTNCMTLARKNPHLDVTVFDRQSICERASRNVAEAGMTDRVRVHPGDLFKDAFPPSTDAVLLAHMLTIWSPENNVRLLRRIHDTLKPGGQVIIFNMMGNDDDSGPNSAAFGSPYFLVIATGEGMLYSWRDYEAFLAEAGFRRTLRRELPSSHGMLVGIK